MGTPCQIDVKLAKIEGRKNCTVKDRDGSSYKAPVFMVSFSVEFGIQFFCLRVICLLEKTGWWRCTRASHDQPKQKQKVGTFGNSSWTSRHYWEPIWQKSELHFLAASSRSRATRSADRQYDIWLFIQSCWKVIRVLQWDSHSIAVLCERSDKSKLQSNHKRRRVYCIKCGWGACWEPLY